jgi:hypothetical protein
MNGSPLRRFCPLCASYANCNNQQTIMMHLFMLTLPKKSENTFFCKWHGQNPEDTRFTNYLQSVMHIV